MICKKQQYKIKSTLTMRRIRFYKFYKDLSVGFINHMGNCVYHVMFIDCVFRTDVCELVISIIHINVSLTVHEPFELHHLLMTLFTLNMLKCT